MPTIKKYQEGLKENIIGFQNELSKRFPNYISTSNYRKGAITKQGNLSRHGIGEATDYSPNPEVKDFIWNTKEGISLLNKYNIGFIDETLPENKKYGNAYHFGSDSVAVSNAKKRYKELIGAQPSETSTTSDFTNLQEIPQNTNFASVPDVYREEETKSSEALNTLKEKEAEKNFMEDFQNLFPKVEYTQQQQEAIQPSTPTDVMGIYNQVSEFVDQPAAQQGGKIIKDNDGYWNPNNWGKKVQIEGGEQKYTENELAFLSEIAIKDNNGQWANPGKITEISSNQITMKGVEKNLLGISKETGEKKVMKPNKNYFFKNTKNVIEIPLR